MPEYDKLLDCELSTNRYLDINSLDKNAFEEFSNLKALKLKFNNLIKIDLERLINLKELFLEKKGQVTRSDECLNIFLPKGLEKLKIIRFGLSLFDLFHIRNLNHLELIFPDRISISANNTKPYNDFKNLKNLKLYFKNCGINDSEIKEIQFGPETLEILDFYCEDLETRFLASFSNLVSLRKLKLDSPCIDLVSFKNLSSLEDLDINLSKLKENEIKSLFKNLSKLKKLKFISRNNLDKDILKHLSNLEYLNMFDCELGNNDLPLLENSPKLTYLNLSFNNFDKLESTMFRGLKALEELDISYNSKSLEIISKGTFNGLNKLIRLNLCWSGIKKMNINSFEGLVNLEDLNLSHNLLKDITIGTFDFIKNLRHLDLCKFFLI